MDMRRLQARHWRRIRFARQVRQGGGEMAHWQRLYMLTPNGMMGYTELRMVVP